MWANLNLKCLFLIFVSNTIHIYKSVFFIFWIRNPISVLHWTFSALSAIKTSIFVTRWTEGIDVIRVDWAMFRSSRGHAVCDTTPWSCIIMVILSQSACSMNVWVCGPIRNKSNDVTYSTQTHSYTPPQGVLLLNCSKSLGNRLNHS